jgi:hypothetical protein
MFMEKFDSFFFPVFRYFGSPDADRLESCLLVMKYVLFKTPAERR